ncbi:MAG: hypothetical protein E6K83_06235 [Thaumarchaeota archaeon]|nr:MAG: hypothetical protein E6K83_06235 [Nitrososphaerota archaeon]
MRNFVAMAFLTVMILSYMIPAASSEISNKNSVKLQNGIWQAKVGKQMQIQADVTNGQDRVQPFAYIVQVQNQDGVTVSLSWLTGTLDSGQSLSPAQSWTPASNGVYTAQIFIWAGIDNPDALSLPLTMTITVT